MGIPKLILILLKLKILFKDNNKVKYNFLIQGLNVSLLIDNYVNLNLLLEECGWVKICVFGL